MVALAIVLSGSALAACGSGGGSGGGAAIAAKVVAVKALDGNTIRVFVRYTNNGKASGSENCVINTTVDNQFGDLVNIHVNSTNTNGNIAPGGTQLLYQDLGVDSGDAGYVTTGDVVLKDCSS